MGCDHGGNDAGTVFGWRARIGLILPADNVLIEPEFYALELPGVSFHGLRLTATEPDAMREQAIELAQVIKELGLDAAVYACAETSFNGGAIVRESLSDTIAKEAEVPVVTATNAILVAADHLGLQRVSVVTPYSEDSAEILEATLTERGIEVVAARHRDFSLESDDPRVWYLTNRQPANTAYDMARGVDDDSAEAILILSTNFATLAIIERLERALNKPVLTTNQAILWWCSQVLGLEDLDLSLGSLFRSDPFQGTAATVLGSAQ